MKIHIVRSPFTCRIGQFEPDKQTLCVGIEVHALREAQTYRCYFGSNRKTCYEITFDKAVEVGQMWVNKTGKQVLILPVFAFDVLKSNWDSEEYRVKEIHRARIIQDKLF